MKIFVCGISENEDVRRHFGNKGNIIPSDSLKKGYFGRFKPEIHASAYNPNSSATKENFEKFFLERVKDADACIVTIDQPNSFFVEDISNACQTAKFDSTTVKGSTKNFFDKLISKHIKILGQTMARFENTKNAELLSLPLRNFQAKELERLRRIFSDLSSIEDFSRSIDEVMKPLRKRVRPRKQSSYKTTYVVDDQGNFFAFGKEKHARPETGLPHSKACAINAIFRFGARIDDQRHYNVSATEQDRTRIAGEFLNCHGKPERVPETTHINMFSNDYFTT